MSQPSSSIMSGDNPEIKYKKALKQISKLISANRALRQGSDKATEDYKEKMNQLVMRYADLEKEYEILRKQKDSLGQFLEEVQENNEQLIKQRKNLERELGYLNDVLAEQNAEIKKIQTYKDEKALANLIRTYEDRENIMERNRNQQDEMISKLKDNLQHLENQLLGEKSLREQLEDKYNRLLLQINKYKELNSTLMIQNQKILKEHISKETFTIEKEKELQLLANQFRRQIHTLRNPKPQLNYDFSSQNYNKNYQELLNEKNQLVLELAKVRDACEEAQQKERELYQMEQRLKHAMNKAERSTQELNMLKSKMVVIEAKQFLDEAGEDDYNQRQFQEKINILMAQHDPVESIKNGDDSSHFRLLKSFILDLQDKIYRLSSDKKELSRKYKSVKSKFVKNAQQLTIHEDQNKVLKGKVQGFQRLTQKLQYQLERSLHVNEDQITKITLTSNNLITKKSQEYKGTISLLNSQLEMQNDKFNRTEKLLKQEIETMKLQLGSLKIKYKDANDKGIQDGEFMELYKKKNDEFNLKVNRLEQELTECKQNILKYENLLKEEKGKNQGLIIQKQQLHTQVKQLYDELDRKTYQIGENSKMKEDHYEFQLKRLSSQNKKLKEDLDYSTRELTSLQREVSDRRGRDSTQVQQISRLTLRNRQLQENIITLKKYTREAEDQKETFKIKASKFQQAFDKANTIEQQLMNKSDLVNDLKRQILTLENDIKSLQAEIKDEKKQTESYKKELSNSKMKNLESNHDIKKQYEAKTLQSKRMIQNLNQEISELAAQIRQQKTKNSRMANELNTAKSQKNRLQQIIQQNRRKQFHIEGQTGNLKIEISNLNMDNEKLKNEIKSLQTNSTSLNQEIQQLQQKIFGLNQEVSGLKMKLQTAQDSKTDLVRDLTSLRNHIAEVQNYSIKLKTASNPTWEEQCFASSLSQIIHKLRKLCRYYDVIMENKAQTVGMPVTVNQSTNKSQFSQQFKSYGKVDDLSGSFSRSPIKTTLRILSSENKQEKKQESDDLGKKYPTTQSLQPIDYTYSNTKISNYDDNLLSSGLGIDLRGTYNEEIDWMNPSYNYSNLTYKGAY